MSRRKRTKIKWQSANVMMDEKKRDSTTKRRRRRRPIHKRRVRGAR